MPSSVEIGTLDLEKTILSFIIVFHYYFPIQKGRCPSSKQTSHKECYMYVQSFVVNNVVVLEKSFLKRIFTISLLFTLERGRTCSPLVKETSIPFTQRCFVLSLVEIGGFREEGFFNIFLIFRYISPRKRVWPFI